MIDMSTFSLSASKIDTFNGCRRLFKYSYLDKPFDPPPNKYFTIGNLVHKTLELFHIAINNHDLDPSVYAEQMGRSFKEAYEDEEIKKKLRTPWFHLADVYDSKEMLQNYLKWIKKQPKPNVAWTEKYFKCVIDGITISGKADRIDEVDGGMLVVDYKTNKKPFKQKDVDASVQLPTYALWIRRSMGMEDEVSGQYVYLRFINQKNGRKNFPITDAKMEAALDKYKYVADQLANGCRFPRNSAYKYCNSCDFRQYCFQDRNNELE